LGDIPGGSFSIVAFDTSADGSVVVGRGTSTGFDCEAYRWTQNEGMVGLGDLGGTNKYSSAYGISADVTVIVGQTSSSLGGEAFLWTAESAVVGLGDFPGLGFNSHAHDKIVFTPPTPSTFRI